MPWQSSHFSVACELTCCGPPEWSKPVSKHYKADSGRAAQDRGPFIPIALQGHIARPGQKRLRRSMRAAIWWLLPSDGIFRRSSNSLQYFLTRQGRRVVLRGGDVAYPTYNSHINWIPDPAPPPSRDHGDLTSPSSSRNHGIQTNGKENMVLQGTPRKLPSKLQSRRRKEKQSGPTANYNSPSREAGKEKQSGPTANHNSPSREAGNQPGTSGSTGSAMRAPVKHPLTFLRPQHPRLTANHNSERRFDPDHSESGHLFKPDRSSIQQDSALRSRRDSFSGSGISSPALQRSHRNSFSGSPSGQLNRNISLTDPIREARITGGLRPGPVQPHPRDACPDTRLDIDAAQPEAAAVSRAERPPTVLDIPETAGDYSLPRITSKAWISVNQAPLAQTAQESLFSVIPAQETPATPRTLV